MLLAVGLAAASIPTAVVLQAVDGIALKRAVDAWVAEGGTVGSASFAAARAIRWVEEGLNAVLGLTLGSTVILAGAAMVRGAVYPRWMGWTGAAIGIGVLISAILVAETGFSLIAQAWVLARNPALWIWTAIPTSMEQLRASPMRLGDKPLIVLARGMKEANQSGSPEEADRAEQWWAELQADLARRSSNGKQVIAEKSGHYIQFYQPDLVIDAVHQVVEAARPGK